MVAQWSQGADVVYAVRKQREGETAFKLATASWFYKLFDKLAQVDLEPNSGDFRLLDRRALDALLAMTERSRFLRGMTVWVGFTQTAVSYERDARHAGETKYTLRKMLRFSLDAIASFSHLPLQLATYVGLLSAGVAFIAIPVVIVLRIADSYLPGFGSITIAILLLGGIQLIALGVIGEYVGRIYDEVKHRPLYIVRDERNRPRGRSAARRSRARCWLARGPCGLQPRVAPERVGASDSAMRRRCTPATAPPPIACCDLPMTLPAPSSAPLAPRRIACALALRPRALALRRPRARRRSVRRLGRGARLPVRGGADHRPARRGRAALPRGGRGRHRRGRVRRRPAELRRAEVHRRRQHSRPSGAPTAAGTASSGRSAAWRPTRRATCTSSTRATTGSRSSTPNGAFITALGPQGRRTRASSNFGSSQNYTQPPGGGIAVAGNYVYVADSGNNRIERFNLEGGEAMEWGDYGQRPGPVLATRAASPPTRPRCSSPTTTTTASRSSTPNGAFEAPVGSQRHRARAVRLPLRRRAGRGRERVRRRRHQPPRRQAQPASSASPARGAASARNPGSSRSRARWRAIPAGDTYVADTANDRVEVFDPERHATCARSAPPRAVPGALTAPRGLAADPTGRLLVSDTVGNRIELFAPGERRVRSAPGRAPADTARASPSPRASRSIRAARCTSPTPATNGSCACGATARSCPNSAARPTSAARSSTARARSPSRRARARLTWPTRATTACSSTAPAASLLAKWGAGGGNGAAGDGPGEFNHPGGGRGRRPRADVYVADTGNNRIVELSPERDRAAASGARAASATGACTPDRRRGRRRRATCTWSTAKTTASRCSTRTGRFLAKWGSRGTGLGEFSQPSAIAVDCDGDVYVADTNNNRVERFDPASPAGGGLPARRAPGRRRWTSRRCCTSACRATRACSRGARSR